jgi:ferredoxin-NADP reductase
MTFDVVVEAVAQEAQDVVSLTLVPASGGSLPTWEPGAHVDVLIPPGLERQYSLCGDPADCGRWRLAALREREGRGGSEWLHTQVRPGQSLTLRGPRNHFELVDARSYLFIAGGIGITPLVPMIRHASSAGREWKLVYGGRRRASMAFVDELEAHDAGRITLWPEDRHGLLELDALLDTPTRGGAVYCCGPEGLIAAVEARCRRWPPGSLHVERFAPRPIDEEAIDASFDVIVASTGRAVPVAGDQSIVDALGSAGIEIETSCREGTCGTCETGVLEGMPDHRDSVLTPDERAANDTMMLCCSRALTPQLILDL